MRKQQLKFFFLVSCSLHLKTSIPFLPHHLWFCFPLCHLPSLNNGLKILYGKFQKQIVTFKLCTIVSSVMHSQHSVPSPSVCGNSPCPAQAHYALSLLLLHLVSIQAVELRSPLLASLSQYLCSRNCILPNNGPKAQSSHASNLYMQKKNHKVKR